MHSVKFLIENWAFTQVGGGDGTKDGEWLAVSKFPTTVHVELLKLNRIPDPVRIRIPLTGCRSDQCD
jgi:beta-mannosidase